MIDEGMSNRLQEKAYQLGIEEYICIHISNMHATTTNVKRGHRHKREQEQVYMF